MKQLCNHSSISDADVYDFGEYSFYVIGAKADFTICSVKTPLFIVADMCCHALGSVTTGGALALAATLVKVKGMVFMMFFIAKIIDIVTIIFAATTTAMTAS